MEPLPLNFASRPSGFTFTGLDGSAADARAAPHKARSVWRARPLADRVPTLVCAAALLAFSPLPFQIASAATPIPVGRWIWDSGEAAVEFHACGPELCGRIVWLRNETAPGVEHAVDLRNPDSSLRARPICGLDYITGLRANQDGNWVAGRIYDFLHGHTYDLDLTNVASDRIDMRGYQGIRLLGTTLHLLPAPADLSACAPGKSNPTQERVK